MLLQQKIESPIILVYEDYDNTRTYYGGETIKYRVSNTNYIWTLMVASSVGVAPSNAANNPWGRSGLAPTAEVGAQGIRGIQGNEPSTARLNALIEDLVLTPTDAKLNALIAPLLTEAIANNSLQNTEGVESLIAAALQAADYTTRAVVQDLINNVLEAVTDASIFAEALFSVNRKSWESQLASYRYVWLRKIEEDRNTNRPEVVIDLGIMVTGSNSRTTVEAAKTTNYTIVAADEGKVIPVNTTGGNLTVTLPDLGATDAGFSVYIQKVVAANTLTIDGHGNDTIDGSEMLGLTRRFHSVELVWTGTEWQVLSDANAQAMVDTSNLANRNLQNILATLTDPQKKVVRDRIDALTEDDFKDHTTDFYTELTGISVADYNMEFEAFVMFTNADGSTVFDIGNVQAPNQTAFWNAVNTANAGRIYIKNRQGNHINNFGFPSTTGGARNPVYADNDVLVFYPSGGEGRVEITLSSGPTDISDPPAIQPSKWYTFDNVLLVGTPTSPHSAYRVAETEPSRIQINRHDITPAVTNVPYVPPKEMTDKKYELEVRTTGDPRWVEVSGNGQGQSGGGGAVSVDTLPSTHTANAKYRLREDQENAEWYTRKFTRVANNDSLNFAANNINIPTGSNSLTMAADGDDEAAVVALNPKDKMIFHPDSGEDTVVTLSGKPTTPSPLNSVAIVSVAAANYTISGPAIVNGTSYTVYVMRVGRGTKGSIYLSDGEQLTDDFEATGIENTAINVATPANENLNIPTKQATARAIDLSTVERVSVLPSNPPAGRKVRLARNLVVDQWTTKFVREGKTASGSVTSTKVYVGNGSQTVIIPASAAEAAFLTARGRGDKIVLHPDSGTDVVIRLSGSPTFNGEGSLAQVNVAAADHTVTGTLVDGKSYTIYVIRVSTLETGSEIISDGVQWGLEFEATIQAFANAKDSTFSFWKGSTNPTGELNQIIIENGGTQYAVGDAITVTGGGVGATGFNITVASVSAAGAITGFTYTNRGRLVTEIPTLGVTSTNGSGAVLRATITPSILNRAIPLTTPDADTYDDSNNRWVLVDGNTAADVKNLYFRNSQIDWTKVVMEAELETNRVVGSNTSGAISLAVGFNDGESPTWGGGGANGLFMWMVRYGEAGHTHDNKLGFFLALNDDTYAGELGNQVVNAFDVYNYLRTDGTDSPYTLSNGAAFFNNWASNSVPNRMIVLPTTVGEKFKLRMVIAGSEIRLYFDGTLYVTADLTRPIPQTFGPRYYFFGDTGVSARRGYLYEFGVGAPPPSLLLEGY